MLLLHPGQECGIRESRLDRTRSRCSPNQSKLLGAGEVLEVFFAMDRGLYVRVPLVIDQAMYAIAGSEASVAAVSVLADALWVTPMYSVRERLAKM